LQSIQSYKEAGQGILINTTLTSQSLQESYHAHTAEIQQRARSCTLSREAPLGVQTLRDIKEQKM